MYARVEDQPPWSPSGSPPAYSNSQYNFASRSESGLPYDATDVYSPVRSTPLSIPKISSSSLAAALDPAPEPDYSRSSVSPSDLVGHTAGQFNPSAFSNLSAASSAGGTEFQKGMPRYAPSFPSSLHSRHQMHHDDNAQRPTSIRPQSHFLGVQTNSSIVSPSTTYPFSHQPTMQMQSEESRWPPDVTFSGYPSSLSLSSVAPTNFPAFPNNYAFDPVGIGEQTLDAYNTSGGGGGWTYSQRNAPFQTSAGMYLDIDQSGSAETGAGAWLGSLDPQGRVQSGPSTSFVDASTPVQHFGTPSGSEAEVNFGLGSSVSGVSATTGRSFDRQQFTRQGHQQFPDSTPPDVREQPKSAPGIFLERLAEESIVRAGSHQSSPPVQSPPNSFRKMRTLQSENGQRGNGRPRQLQGHNVLMPPPPLPSRGQTMALTRDESSNRSFSRRHTVAAPPSNRGVDLARDASPTSSLASARPSSAAPESSGSCRSRSDDTPATPGMAILSLNDRMWTEDQESQRSGLSETFRLNHGREPPEEMRIPQTNALERSERNDALLLGSPIEGKILQHDATARSRESSSGQSLQSGAELACASGPPTSSEDMSDEEFFSHQHTDWAPARSRLEMGSSNTRPGANSLVSPISPTTTDELVSPSDATATTPVAPPQVPYAYAVPANPSALNNILSVIRHDGHLPTHVSGLGGTFVSAYDGRSYLTDDSELDPDHLPPAPPGARSGDNPSLQAYLPHPLAKRGQVWHDLISPSRASKDSLDRQKGAELVQHDDSGGKEEGRDEEAALKKLEKQNIKSEEQGEGWGFPEGGSHGPHLMLPGKDRGPPSTKAHRLKLSTEKKTPPKMACHFCRNRKIACGASRCGDAMTCNQCERRSLPCTFPTVSRRGMRTRGPRSAHTVDGTDEADKDSVEHDGSAEPLETSQDPTDTSGANSSKKSSRAKKQPDKDTKDKEATKVKGRGKRRRKTESSGDQQEESSIQLDETADEDGNDQGNGSDMQVDEISGRDDPLASLAAEMSWSHRPNESLTVASSMQFDTTSSSVFSGIPPSLSTSSLSTALHFPPTTFENSFPASTSSDAYALNVGPTPGPFTTAPLQRRNQGGIGGDGSGSCQ